jgi:hypothetical protein
VTAGAIWHPCSMPTWELSYRGPSGRTQASTERGWGEEFHRFSVRDVSGTMRGVVVAAEDVPLMALTGSVAWRFHLDGEDAVNRLDGEDAVNRYVSTLLLLEAVPRLVAELEGGGSPREEIVLGRESLSGIEERLIGRKRCRWRHQEEGEDWCAAAAGDTSPLVVTKQRNGRKLAATTERLCDGCGVPDARLICSHFVHPSVTGTPAENGTQVERTLSGAECNIGRNCIAEDPTGCVPGGHSCWRRLVEPERRKARPVPPLAIVEALDFLDAVWRLTFDRQRLIGTTALVHIARLEQQAVDRQDVRDRLSDLADVFDALEIPAPLAPSPPGREGTLLRLNRLLSEKIIDPEGIERVSVAVEKLRAVVRIRAGLQHSGAGPSLPASFAVLGIGYPPDWTLVWDQIKEAVIEALTVLRDEVRRLSDRD